MVGQPSLWTRLPRGCEPGRGPGAGAFWRARNPGRACDGPGPPARALRPRLESLKFRPRPGPKPRPRSRNPLPRRSGPRFRPRKFRPGPRRPPRFAKPRPGRFPPGLALLGPGPPGPPGTRPRAAAPAKARICSRAFSNSASLAFWSAFRTPSTFERCSWAHACRSSRLCPLGGLSRRISRIWSICSSVMPRASRAASTAEAPLPRRSGRSSSWAYAVHEAASMTAAPIAICLKFIILVFSLSLVFGCWIFAFQLPSLLYIETNRSAGRHGSSVKTSSSIPAGAAGGLPRRAACMAPAPSAAGPERLAAPGIGCHN